MRIKLRKPSVMVEIPDRRDTDIEIKKSLLELYQIFLDMTVMVEVKTLKHNQRSSRK